MYPGELGDRLGFLGPLNDEEKRNLFLGVAQNVVTAAVLWMIWLAVRKGRATANI